MGEGIKAFWLGFFIVVTVAVTAWLVTFLNPSVGDCGHKLKVRFSDIQDISIGTRVTFGGRPVGRVTKITMIPDARNLPPDAEGTYYVYQLELCVDSSVHVYTYDEIMFSVAGLMGEKSISILPRVTPAGAPAAKEIINTVLYGTSKDSVQQALAELTNVARDMEHTLHTLDAFLDKNLEPFHQATVALSKAADSLDGLVHQINDTHLITRINSAADSVTSLANRISDSQIIPSLSCTLDRIACGQGTLGRLVNSDAAYLQLTSVLCSLDTLVSDLKNYGIFFQFSHKWRRQRCCKQQELTHMCSSQNAVNYFNQQLCGIQNTMAQLETQSTCINDCLLRDEECSQSFADLLLRVENLTRSLKNYREFLSEQYCDCCY